MKMKKKEYYSIKEVEERTGISAYTLRYYDKMGLLPFVERTPSGIRRFKESDFEALFTITCLKKCGMPIADIKTFMELYMTGSETIPLRRKMFEEQRERIKEQIASMQKMLDIIDYKCWYFQEAEKYSDVYYYRNLPEDEIPQRIRDFMRKVDNFEIKE